MVLYMRLSLALTLVNPVKHICIDDFIHSWHWPSSRAQVIACDLEAFSENLPAKMWYVAPLVRCSVTGRHVNHNVGALPRFDPFLKQQFSCVPCGADILRRAGENCMTDVWRKLVVFIVHPPLRGTLARIRRCSRHRKCVVDSDFAKHLSSDARIHLKPTADIQNGTRYFSLARGYAYLRNIPPTR